MLKFNLYTEGGTKVFFIGKENPADNKIAKWAMDKKLFKGKLGEVFYYPSMDEEASFLVGLGDVTELELDDVRLLSFKLAQAAKKNHENTLEVKMLDLGFCQRKTIMAFAEGFYHSQYEFNRKGDKDCDEEISDITINYSAHHGPEEKLQQGLDRIKNQMDGVFFARDLVNARPNEIYPETLAAKTKEKLEEVGINVTVLNKSEIEELGMEAFLSVARGSSKEPKFIIMEHKGNPDSDEVTGLVGKGLTYDSGGYSIKPTPSMLTMNSDMGGSGTVIGTMYALGLAKAKANVIAVVAACENMISGDAYKPGDIIGSMSGKTIEILNTDAEGRLTLADALYYITNEKKVNRVIDLATLTGACLVALGEEYTGSVTNNEEFFSELQEAAKESGEKIWLMPNDKAFKKMNCKSKTADLVNSPGRFGGMITAGLFVGEFLADENTPWIHLDIAGTAYLDSSNKYLPKMATGVHVKTLFNLVNPLIGC